MPDRSPLPRERFSPSTHSCHSDFSKPAVRLRQSGLSTSWGSILSRNEYLGKFGRTTTNRRRGRRPVCPSLSSMSPRSVRCLIPLPLSSRLLPAGSRRTSSPCRGQPISRCARRAAPRCALRSQGPALCPCCGWRGTDLLKLLENPLQLFFRDAGTCVGRRYQTTSPTIGDSGRYRPGSGDGTP